MQPRTRMKKSPKKLALATETIRRLDDVRLAAIRGGAASSEDKFTYLCTLGCYTRIG